MMVINPTICKSSVISVRYHVMRAPRWSMEHPIPLVPQVGLQGQHLCISGPQQQWVTDNRKVWWAADRACKGVSFWYLIITQPGGLDYRKAYLLMLYGESAMNVYEVLKLTLSMDLLWYKLSLVDMKTHIKRYVQPKHEHASLVCSSPFPYFSSIV